MNDNSLGSSEFSEALNGPTDVRKITLATHEDVAHRLRNHEMRIQPCNLLGRFRSSYAMILKAAV